MKQWIMAGVLVMLTVGAANADGVKVTPVAHVSKTISGQTIKLPDEAPTVNVSIYEIPAGMALPQHRHSYPRYGYVLEGQLQVTNAATGVTSDFSKGNFVVESLNQWHTGKNPGGETLKLLVIDQVPEGDNNVELHP